jgi:signal transduction histidine kinase
VLEVGRELTSTLALEPLLQKIVHAAAELTDSEAVSLLLLSSSTGELRFRATTELRGEDLRGIPVPVQSSIAGDVMLTGTPARIKDTRQIARHYGRVSQEIGIDVASLLAVPLHVRERRIGVLEAVNKRCDGGFNLEDQETLQMLATQAAIAIENARLVGALRAANDQLGRLDRLKSEFIAVASHELRTPLALILGYASYLQEDVDPVSAGRLEIVIRAATRLRTIIETMLNLRYLETGQSSLDLTYFDLRDEVAAVCREYQLYAEANGVTIESDLPAQPVLIRADRGKVRVIIDNLVSNAIKFNLPEGRARVAARSLGDRVIMRVADTGVGIPKEELGRVFDRFGQLEDHMTRRHSGMGLGLAIVKGLVERHGGRVWAESIVGQGTSFVVTLPADGICPGADQQAGAAERSG